MQVVYEAVLVEESVFILGQVCKEFRLLTTKAQAKKLNTLIQAKKKPVGFFSTQRWAETAIEYSFFLDLLECCREHVPSWICSLAAKKGNLSVLQWAVKRGYTHSHLTCSEAVKRGDKEMLQWLISTGCGYNAFLCASAAEVGNLEMLQWLRERGFPWNEYTSMYAIEKNHLHVLQWARSQGWFHVP